MSFSVSYELLRGDVNVAPSGSVADDSRAYVVIYTSNIFEIDGVYKEQLVIFGIPCPNNQTALSVKKSIEEIFNSGRKLVFSGTFFKNNFVTVLTPYEHFLPEAVKK